MIELNVFSGGVTKEHRGRLSWLITLTACLV
jgi:hypothetical protein